MKKFLVLLVSIVMVFAMSSPVSAAPIGLSIEANLQTAIKGEAVELKIDLSNGSDASEDNLTLLVLAERLDGNSSWEIGRSNQVHLLRNQTQTFSCVTSFTETGVYKITAQLYRNRDQYISMESHATVIVTERASRTENYTVKFDYNGSNGSPASKRVTTGNAYGTLPEPTRAGYIFAGWSADGTLKGVVREDTIVNIIGDHTLKALWAVDISSEYRIIYNGNGATNGSSPIDTSDYDAGSVGYILGQGNLGREGHVFTGWNTRADGTGTAYKSGERITVRENVVLYAQWKVEANTHNAYRITYYGNGATSGTVPVDAASYSSGSSGYVAGQGNLRREGYAFSDWNTRANGRGTAYKVGEWLSVKENISLYAQWTAETYTVWFDYQSGTGSPDSKRVTFDSTYGSLPKPTRQGYTFAGWSSNGKQSGVVRTETTVNIAGNHTLTALWTANPKVTYKITYHGNGATSGAAPVDDESYSSGSRGTVSGQGDLVRRGYTFAGWNTKADGSGTSYKAKDKITVNGNITLYAQWASSSGNNHHDSDIKVSGVSHGNGQANINFSIRSANGKGYKVYTSESKDGPWHSANANFNSKGAHVKGLTNGKTYYAYVEYSSDDITEKSEVVQLKPKK